jgi:threonine dehydratase
MTHHTPVMTSKTFDELVGATVFFKCENFQKMGAFKMRGAAHALTKLSQMEKDKGVITHSSGNFAQALALAAQMKHVKATIVMPENTTPVKVDAVRGYGADVVFSGPKPTDREEKVAEIMSKTPMTLIHPSNNLQVILGNSTLTQEFHEQAHGLDFVITPVGGGGLLAGTALAVHWFSPQTEVIAAEPEKADDAYRSLKSGKIETNVTADTIADGLRTNLGDINFPIIKELVKEVMLVSEQEIIDAMKWVWERMKLVIEPSAAVGVAAVIRNKERFAKKRVGIVLTGGNVDLTALPW